LSANVHSLAAWRQRRSAYAAAASGDSTKDAPSLSVQPANRLLTNDRQVAACLAAAAGLAWVATFGMANRMTVGLAAFVSAWTIMMAAMMLPSVSPLVLLYARNASARSTTLLVAGYLCIWAAAAAPARLGGALMPAAWSPFVLALAGLYQFTPAKRSCLAKCRSPADFLMQHWGRSPLRLGIEHGLWCLGCCWALMAVLVLVGMMSLSWVVGLAVLVALEKLAPRGDRVAHLTGAAFLLLAIIQEV
jgi:predicted metal-binding membrane protein